MRLVLLLALAALVPAADAQLQIHAAVAPDTEGDTDGMTVRPVVTVPGHEVWVGDVVLDLPPASIQTVGLETDDSGGSALSLWLTDDAGRAFSALTAESVGKALAVVHDGRVLVAPVVTSPIPNGLVLITGLGAAEAERLAESLRSANEPPAPVPPAPLPLPGARPLEPVPPTFPPRSPVPDPQPDAASRAGQAALRFTSAIAARDWRTAAASLHPQSLRVARSSAMSILELEGGTVNVRSGGREGAFAAAGVLGIAPSGRLADLDDRDLGALYLAALDVLGAWGATGAARRVVGEVTDGDRVHVILRAESAEAGVSDVLLVTVARDGLDWRPLLTPAQRF